MIAGEASGDLHGSNLIYGLRKADPEAQFRFWGGDKMAEAGGTENLAKHYNDASFFGVTEVLKNLGTIMSQFKDCQRDVVEFDPDVLILIDYPGFNFKMAKFAHKRGLKVFYYIAPKVWAWKESRVKLIRKYVDKLFIIFPFEIDYFSKRGIEPVYEGNPLMDSVERKIAAMPSKEEFFALSGLGDKPVVALLAGSRKSEIKNHLPFMVELSRRFPDHQFVVAGVSWMPVELYESLIGDGNVKVVSDRTYELLRYSEAAVVTSGTATLETALIGTPEIVCYRIDGLTANIVKRIIKVSYISLVNLIMDRPVVKELIQWDMTLDNAERELRAVLPGGENHDRIKDNYEELRRVVGGGGASERFGRRMVEILKEGGL